MRNIEYYQMMLRRLEEDLTTRETTDYDRERKAHYEEEIALIKKQVLFSPQKEHKNQIEEWKKQILLLSQEEREEGAVNIVIRLIKHIEAINKTTQQPDEWLEKLCEYIQFCAYPEARGDRIQEAYNSGLDSAEHSVREYIENNPPPKRESGSEAVGVGALMYGAFAEGLAVGVLNSEKLNLLEQAWEQSQSKQFIPPLITTDIKDSCTPQ